MKATNFTVNYLIDGFRNGEKYNNLLSVTFEPTSTDVELLPEEIIRAKLLVIKSCLHTALISGDISIEEAQNRKNNAVEVSNTLLGLLSKSKKPEEGTEK